MSTVIRVDSLRSVAYGSITSSYTTLGIPFGHLARIVRLINNTNGDMFFSFDATNDNIFVPAGSFVLYDASANICNNESQFSFSLNSQLYIKYSSAPTQGSVYLELLYGQGQ